MTDTIFGQIARGELPADVVYEDDRALAFRDISPQAPTHVLVVPRVHQPDVGSLAEADPEAAAGLVRLARRVAEDAGGSHRLVFNTGADAGQTVFHCHGHVLAGRPLGWPPG